MYLCVVVVTCTGIIVSKISSKPNEDTPEEKEESSIVKLLPVGVKRTGIRSGGICLFRPSRLCRIPRLCSWQSDLLSIDN